MYVSNPELMSQDAYVPGLTREHVSATYGIALGDVAKLGSAENPLGPSPLAAAAVQSAMSKLEIYPEWTSRALREKVAQKYGFAPDQVVCGAGETEIISWIVRIFSAPGDKLLMFAPAFPIYHITAVNEGRDPLFVGMGDELDFRMDEFVAQIPNARIVFLTNPHSPTSRLMSEAQIRRVCEAARDQLVVLDEAYIHFTETPGGMHLLAGYPNLIVLRTFSKAFGLAGLRIGFAIAAPDVIRPMLNLKPTWNLGQLQTAGAAAALDDEAHVERTVREIVTQRDFVVERIGRLNRFSVVGEPRSNFFLLRIEDESLDSTAAFNALLERGVIVKDGSVSFVGLGKHFLRIDVSLRQHMERLLAALGELETRA
jgi:histidinol-phosphate aminotransferase